MIHVSVSFGRARGLKNTHYCLRSGQRAASFINDFLFAITCLYKQLDAFDNVTWIVHKTR